MFFEIVFFLLRRNFPFSTKIVRSSLVMNATKGRNSRILFTADECSRIEQGCIPLLSLPAHEDRGYQVEFLHFIFPPLRQIPFFPSAPRSLAGYPPYVSPSSSISSPSLLANSRDIHPSVVRLAPFCEQSGRQDKYGKRGAGMRSAPRRRRRRGFRNNTIISRNHPAVPPRNQYLSRSYEARLNLSEVVSRERNILSPR